VPEFVVLKQNFRDDSWDSTYVDVTAESAEEAIEVVAKEGDRRKGGGGRYVAIPNEWWIAQDVVVERIAEVHMTPVELV
jgi:hypothetical protein